MSTHESLFRDYALAFERGDVEALLGLYRWPVSLVTVGSTVVWSGPDQAGPMLQGLLARYASWGVHRVEVLSVDATEAGEHLRCLVTWSLVGHRTRRFRTVYWVCDGLITAVLVIDEPAE